MQLTAQNVNDVFMDCLFKENERHEGAIIGKGIMTDFGFHPVRLSTHTMFITEMINQLPETFKKSLGGGWSFLNMDLDKDGNQWADMHVSMEQLFSLGNAIGKMDFNMPRSLWAALPGGMPYVYIKD